MHRNRLPSSASQSPRYALCWLACLRSSASHLLSPSPWIAVGFPACKFVLFCLLLACLFVCFSIAFVQFNEFHRANRTAGSSLLVRGPSLLAGMAATIGEMKVDELEKKKRGRKKRRARKQRGRIGLQMKSFWNAASANNSAAMGGLAFTTTCPPSTKTGCSSGEAFLLICLLLNRDCFEMCMANACCRSCVPLLLVVVCGN